MSGFSSTMGRDLKQRLLTITLVMEVYTLGASAVGMATSNSIVFVANFIIALTGVLAAGLSLHTVKRMARGVDLENSYGFGRLEVASTTVVALTMILAVLFISFELFEKIQNPGRPEGGLFALFLTCLSLAVSVWLWIRNYRLAQSERAPIFEAMWRMMRMGAMEDTLIILAVGVSLLFSGQEWAYLVDVAASSLLILVVLKSIGEVLSGTFGELMDRSIEERDQVAIIRELVNHFDEYEQIYGFRTRRSGSQTFVELFLGFAPERTMGEVYQASARIRQAIRRRFPSAQVLVIPTAAPMAEGH